MSRVPRDKLYESTMQEWFEGLGCIASAIDRIDWNDPLGLGVEAHQGNLSAIRDAKRVYDTLYEAERRSNDDNIANKKGEVFRPDLLYFSDGSGAFVVVELKATAAAARQALTEVLGYAEEIRKQTRGTQVFIVIVAHQWNPLLDNAVAAQMRSRHFPLLPLEFFDEDGFRLRLRTEPFLPRPDASKFFDEHAFRCDTRAFFYQNRFPVQMDRAIANVRIEEEAQHIASRGERTGYSGFVIAWSNSQAWALTTCLFNPARLDVPDTSNPLFAQDDPDWIDMDAGSQLLDDVNGSSLPDEDELGGQQGWLNQERALKSEDAMLIEVCMWGQHRDSLGSFKERLVKESLKCTDFSFPTTHLRHPFIWIPYLFELMGLSVDMDIPGLSRYYRLGEAIGSAMAYYTGAMEPSDRVRDFGYLAAMGRLLDAWRRVAIHAGDGGGTQPTLRFEDDGMTLCRYVIEDANNWARWQAERVGDWPLFAHRLGFAHGLTTFVDGEALARSVFDTKLDEDVNVKLIAAARADSAFALAGSGKSLLDYVQHCCREHLLGPSRFSYNSLRFGTTCEVIIALADEWVLFNAARPAGVDFR